MGQRLPSLDLSGLLQGTTNAANITARTGAIGLKEGAENAVGGILKRRALAQQDRQLDISASHLDLEKQAQQDRRDAMTLKILDAEDATDRAGVDAMDPQSVAEYTQKAEDRHIIRQTLLQRLTGSPVVQAQAQDQAAKRATWAAEDAHWEKFNRDYSMQSGHEVGTDKPSVGTMPFGGYMPSPKTDANPNPLGFGAEAEASGLPAARTSEDQDLIDAYTKGKAARGQQDALNKQAADEEATLNRRVGKMQPGAVATARARINALREAAKAQAIDAARYEGYTLVEGKNRENDRAIAKQAAASEEMRKRAVAEADQKETQAVARLNEALKAGAYERIGISKGDPPFTSTDDFKARTQFATRSTTQQAGFEHQDTEWDRRNKIKTEERERFQKEREAFQAAQQDKRLTAQQKAEAKRAYETSRARRATAERADAAASLRLYNYITDKKNNRIGTGQGKWTPEEASAVYRDYQDHLTEFHRLQHEEETGEPPAEAPPMTVSDVDAEYERQKAVKGIKEGSPEARALYNSLHAEATGGR